jgi:hypothetical protein
LVSAREVRELLKQPSIRDNTYSDITMELWVFADDSALLLLPDGRGRLYPSHAEFMERHRQSEELARRGGVDISFDLLPPVDDFIRDVATHAASVGAALRVPEEALDGSEESLNTVLKAIRRLPQDEWITPQVFTPVVAYVGEYMRVACNGHWAPRGEGNEPMVIAPNGYPLQPYVIVLVEIMEYLCRGSLRGAVRGALSGPQIRVFPRHGNPPVWKKPR